MSKRMQGQPPIRVLVLRVGQAPVIEEIDTGLDAMQKIVGGYVECLVLDRHVDLWCNEDGSAMGLPLNRRFAARAPELPSGLDFAIFLAPDLADPGQMGEHRIHGDFFLARHDGDGGTLSLTDEDIEKYHKVFEWAEPLPRGSNGDEDFAALFAESLKKDESGATGTMRSDWGERGEADEEP